MVLELCSIPIMLFLTLVAKCFDPIPVREVDGFDDWNTRENTEKCAEFYNVPEPMIFPDVEFHDMRKL